MVSLTAVLQPVCPQLLMRLTTKAVMVPLKLESYPIKTFTPKKQSPGFTSFI